MFNNLNDQQLFTPFVADDNNPLCFNWQQSSNEDRKFLLNLMKSIIAVLRYRGPSGPKTFKWSG